MKLNGALVVNMLAVAISAYILPGVEVAGYGALFLAAVVLGFANSVLKPILLLLTLPITIVTLGLFSFILNALMVLLTSAIVPGFVVDGFITALLFSLILSLVSSVLNAFVK
jgi:putative membrane protein